MRKIQQLFIVLLFTLLIALPVMAEPVNIYLFHGITCPHCHEEMEYLDKLIEERGPENIRLYTYEVWQNETNAGLMREFSSAFDFEPTGVPLTFIGDQYWVGFSESVESDITSAVDAQIASDKKINTADIVNGYIEAKGGGFSNSNEVTLPIIGKIDLSGKNSFLVTLIVGLADGVNPCSLWVLTMLLTIVIHTDSRKKSFIVGAVYIFITAAIYALFILGVFSLLDYTSYIPQIQVIVSFITLIIGIINIKDFFWYKKGVSLTINDKKKPGLYAKMRNIVNNSESLPAMIAATAALSVMVSLIEFSCTMAFPVVWSNILSQQGVTGSAFFGYLLLYMVLYQLDEIAIFVVAVITMKSKRVEEKHGRFLKLFSGCMMVALSIVMIMNPALMNNIGSVLLVFGSSIAAALLIQFIYQSFAGNTNARK